MDVSEVVAQMIGMTPDDAQKRQRLAVGKAAEVLIRNGYTQREGLWYARESEVPERDACPIVTLGAAILEGHISCAHTEVSLATSADMESVCAECGEVCYGF